MTVIDREADGPVESGSTKKPASGGKMVAPRCVSQPCQRAGEKPESHKRMLMCSYLLKNPSDDVLESLCKLRIRESPQLRPLSGLDDMVINQKISMPSLRTLKTMVKRIIDQKL